MQYTCIYVQYVYEYMCIYIYMLFYIRIYLYTNDTVFENTLLSNSEKARISQILFATSPGVKYLKEVLQFVGPKIQTKNWIREP